MIIASITTFLYFAFSFISKTNTKNPIALSVRFAIAQLLIWVPLVYSVITYDNSNINLINLFILTSLSSATFIHYLIKNKSFSNLTTFFIIVLFIVKISLLLIFGLNHILLTQENHVLVSVPTPISIVKIISISYVSVLIFFVVCLVIHLQSAIGVKIFKKKKVIN
ncbi:MSC_0624 family F1-like ATPase-associated membrane protein [Mycoplasmopsis cynos]|uniref:MSC_0624 family F1-like ATPase-associated membrane protein n=1 Tax=Mycoplasmopsis cynos TaxID=171284 RepID=UPI003A5C8553